MIRPSPSDDNEPVCYGHPHLNQGHLQTSAKRLAYIMPNTSDFRHNFGFYWGFYQSTENEDSQAGVENALQLISSPISGNSEGDLILPAYQETFTMTSFLHDHDPIVNPP
jgi:hypothetical protein